MVLGPNTVGRVPWVVWYSSLFFVSIDCLSGSEAAAVIQVEAESPRNVVKY